MKAKKWIRNWFIIIMLIPIVGGFNYVIDPYGYFNQKDKFIEDLTRINKPIVLNTKLYSRGKIYIIGTSRQMRINPKLIEKYTKQYIQNINISGSTLSENYMISKKVKKLNKNFIYGFDCFSLNKYRMENFSQISDRYRTYEKELSNESNVVIKGLVNIDMLFESIKYFFKKYIFLRNLDYIELLENNKLYDYNKTKIIDDFNNKREKSSYKNYTLYKDKKIMELAKIADKNDIFIIYPKYIFYYKMFQKYQNIETKYFHAIKLLVKNTKAKVFIFYGVNELTTNIDNFDTNGWHFKPKIAKILYDEVYGVKQFKNGFLLTKNNVDYYLKKLHVDVKKYQLEVFGKTK